MQPRAGERTMPPALWTLVLVGTILAIIAGTVALFTGVFNSVVPVTLTSDRSGLVMESGAKVKMRGVQVGRVVGIEGGSPVRLRLELYPDATKYIPANVEAQIRATTAFGAKYVDFTYPNDPSPKHIAAGAVLVSRNVSTEVNTVFQNIIDVLKKIDPPKLNAVLTAVADAVRGQGERIGQATVDANQVLSAINPRMDTVDQDWRSFKGFNDTYSSAAQDILSTLNAASATSATVKSQESDLDTLLLNTIGLSQDGIRLIGPNKDTLVRAVNVLQPTTDLLMKYNPEYTCMLLGAKWFLDNGGYAAVGGNGRSLMVDAALLLGDDPYRYPDNLPIVAAKGGPGGKPGCGSLPDVTKNFPVRQLITNTGWGTGVDIRPNPGVGFPGWMNYFPVTRAVPEPPSIRNLGGPAPGPMPYPGGPAYGAPQFGPDGAPLYPPSPGSPPASDPMPTPSASVSPEGTSVPSQGSQP
ncbi:MCE family protein [Mycobacterium sp. CVI_P3]|uniref:MCE family protein n=1 Tax=Mycobacterium pinniadriaticum TaxID=2994102 RepID=A0ABT3SNS2_9MYCO|nr:MCE family protein [Mycobacterium pinniadriaticum]MCX2934749.1 MCE family protein [Mycobacterium pinniadriaticum]MCX2941171.1 MCE family protein [Mycobacterium pinniadriaticum]